MNDQEISPAVCLLPSGSAGEKIPGISHLFEHLLIVKFLYLHGYKIRKPDGFTTEDYVILFLYEIPVERIMEILRQISVEAGELEAHKQVLIEEIKKESANEQEAFFRFVWQGTGTGYEKSPLGTIEGVNGVTKEMAAEFREEILRKQIFFYSTAAGLEIMAPGECEDRTVARVEPQSPPVMMTCRKDETYRLNGKDRRYNICYFNNRIEAFYLLERILKAANPGKHIQLSEKKRMSALIMEAGVQFPTAKNIAALREQALKELAVDISGIKVNIKERALNELESVYFYGKPWQERIKELFQINNRQLLNLVTQM